MIRYQLFPRSIGSSKEIEDVINCFKNHYAAIESPSNKLTSNQVLKVLESDLTMLGFKVEKSKKNKDKIKVPVLYGMNNSIDKHFDADALSNDGRLVLEVEAGRAYSNNQFLKDLFQSCMMYGVEYLIIAVRNNYKNSDDYKTIYNFFETLYINSRLQLPLKGVLLIGY